MTNYTPSAATETQRITSQLHDAEEPDNFHHIVSDIYTIIETFYGTYSNCIEIWRKKKLSFHLKTLCTVFAGCVKEKEPVSR